jgi:spermidine synthase
VLKAGIEALPIKVVPWIMHNRVLVLSVFVVASCGLAYELIAGALSSYLLGDSVLQFSSIIGCYLFAMGVGAHFSKYIPEDEVLDRFVDIELLIALIGGVSATLLFFAFSWLATPFRSVLYAVVFLIGMMVGMEVPLVMRALNQRQGEFKEIVSKVLTFDYLGALAVSLLFPLLLAPKLGLARTAFLFGICNALVALWMTKLFQNVLKNAKLQALKAVLVLCLLLIGFGFSDRMTQWTEKRLFGDEIVHAESSQYQRLVVTRFKDDIRLHINGNLQFSSKDEHRYHEALVHPALQTIPAAKRVLVLGGGDGLAAREILKYPNVQEIVLVDLDPLMTSLFKTSSILTQLNKNSLNNPKVKIVNEDAFRWLENNSEFFDAAVVDFPDPSNYALGKLYSVPFYRLLAKHIAPQGLMVIQSTSPYFAPNAFWSIDTTLRESGLRTWPYHAYVPSFGEWGFIIASKAASYQKPTRYDVATAFLDASTTTEMFQFPKDMAARVVEPNYLNNQRLVRYFEEDWGKIAR